MTRDDIIWMFTCMLDNCGYQLGCQHLLRCYVGMLHGTQASLKHRFPWSNQTSILHQSSVNVSKLNALFVFHTRSYIASLCHPPFVKAVTNLPGFKECGHEIALSNCRVSRPVSSWLILQEHTGF